MARSKQPLPSTVTTASGVAAAPTGDIAQLVEDLDAMLTRLRLGAIREQLDGLLEEAARRQLNLREALAWLCAAEVASKEQRRLSMAMTIAHFPFVRTLEGFEFEAQPSIDPAKIRDLATCRWVANGDNVVLLGPPGVGKTHLEVALGREAVSRGYTVQFTTAMELLGALVKGQQQGNLEMRLAQYSKPKLLIVDELGYLPLEPQAGHLFFQLISRRYEQGSVLISSNRPVEEWDEVFGDQVVASAILDRLLHHSHVVTIRGDSYRLREKRRSGLFRPQTGGSSSSGIRRRCATDASQGGLRTSSQRTPAVSKDRQRSRQHRTHEQHQTTPHNKPKTSGPHRAGGGSHFDVAGGSVFNVA